MLSLRASKAASAQTLLAVGPLTGAGGRRQVRWTTVRADRVGTSCLVELEKQRIGGNARSPGDCTLFVGGVRLHRLSHSG